VGEFIRVLFMIQNLISSVAMGIYMHVVFRGPFSIYVYEFSMHNPTTVNFSLGINQVGLPIAFYLLSQTVAMAFRPPGSVGLVAAAWISTIFPLGEIAVASFNLDVMTLFQHGAWKLWAPLEIADLLYFVVGARLLQRSVFGEVERGGHHGL
jgi:hypothetical protein